LYASDSEADDVIAHLCKNAFRSDQKVIMSSDKDFYQLLDDQTRIYSLHKKTYVTSAVVLEEFRVSARNFAVAKALCGDPSDNIDGIKGLGFKKAAKLFPMLGSETEDVLIQDVLSFCNTHRDESKVYERVLEEQKNVQRNWRLVYLDGSMLPQNQAQRIDHTVSTFQPTVDRFGFMRLLVEEGINDINVESFYYSFNCIEGLVYR
jgi:5'-3' exonuclease